ncbi:polysaccharide biosynthesis protein [Corynebacterium sp. S7]
MSAQTQTTVPQNLTPNSSKRAHYTVRHDLAMYGLDVASWAVAFVIAAIIRLEFDLQAVPWTRLFGFIVAAWFLQFVLGYTFRHYGRTRYARVGGIDEAMTSALIVGGIGLVLWLVPALSNSPLNIGASIFLMASLLALLFMFAGRYIIRVKRERSNRPSNQSTAALVYGGGYVGRMMVDWMMSSPDSTYRPVGFLDDDPQAKNLRVRGVRVLGTLDDLDKAVGETGAQILIVAISNADGSLFRDVQQRAKDLGIKVKVVGSLENVVGDEIRTQDLRDLAIEDLLGRTQVETNVGEIASYLTGKRVLVTGAGGSIGSQLCSEIAKFYPAELMMLDRDETGLQTALINVAGNGLLDTVRRPGLVGD